jgi:hypothetical protein
MQLLRSIFTQFRVFAVKSIHGNENMRDYIGFLKEAGFELKAHLN